MNSANGHCTGSITQPSQGCQQFCWNLVKNQGMDIQMFTLWSKR